MFPIFSVAVSNLRSSARSADVIAYLDPGFPTSPQSRAGIFRIGGWGKFC
jgi:hypothetical protein